MTGDPPSTNVSFPPATTSFWTLSASTTVVLRMSAQPANAIARLNTRVLTMPPGSRAYGPTLESPRPFGHLPAHADEGWRLGHVMHRAEAYLYVGRYRKTVRIVCGSQSNGG